MRDASFGPLPPSQIIDHFDIFRYIVFVMHLDTVHSKIYICKKTKMTHNNLGHME